MGKRERTDWPAWRYGPGGEARIFQEDEPIPEGWVDHPSLLAAAPEPATSLTGSESIAEIEAAYAEGRVTLDEIEAAEQKRSKQREGILNLLQTERARLEARAEGLSVLRAAGVAVSDDITDEELSAALDQMED